MEFVQYENTNRILKFLCKILFKAQIKNLEWSLAEIDNTVATILVAAFAITVTT